MLMEIICILVINRRLTLTPKAYFNQVFELERKMDSKISERDAIMGTLTGAPAMEENKTYSNQFHSTTESAVMRLIGYSDQTNEYVSELVNLQIRISNEINYLEKYNHQMVLRERYLCSKKFEEIAVEQNYGYRHVIRLHGEALKEFGQLYPDKFSR